MKSVASPAWRASVYKPPGMSRKEWLAWLVIKNRVLTRDGYACAGCGGSFRLTAHHMVPRLEGGPRVEANLLTLCERCHDLVEPEAGRLQSPASIKSFLDSVLVRPMPRTETPRKEPVASLVKFQRHSSERPEWHARVYGGQRG